MLDLFSLDILLSTDVSLTACNVHMLRFFYNIICIPWHPKDWIYEDINTSK